MALVYRKLYLSLQYRDYESISQGMNLFPRPKPMPLPDYGMGAPKIWKGRVRLLPQAVFFAYSKCLYARFGRIFGRPDKKNPA